MIATCCCRRSAPFLRWCASLQKAKVLLHRWASALSCYVGEVENKAVGNEIVVRHLVSILFVYILRE